MKIKKKKKSSKSLGHSKGSLKREVCINTGLPQINKEKSQIYYLTLHVKELEKEKQSPKLVGRIIKMSRNKTETKRKI